MHERTPAIDAPRGPIVVGHRGAPRLAPENTLASFAAALEAGVDGIELDVRRSADGVPVIMHDATLDRTTNATGAVAARKLADLVGLPIVDSDGRPTSLRIPTLAAALAAFAARTRLFIEIKAESAAEARDLGACTARMAAASRAAYPPVLMSFQPDALESAGAAAPALERCALFQSDRLDSRRGQGRIVESAAELGVRMVGIQDTASSAALVDDAHRHGLRVYTWPRAGMREVWRGIAAGADVMATDDPTGMLARLAERGSRKPSTRQSG